MNQETRGGWELVAAAQAGNSEAFAELYRRYQPGVRRYVAAQVRDEALTDDLTSESFLRAWLAIGSVRDTGRDVGAWLMTIARNKVIDQARASARCRHLTSIDDLTGGHPADPAPSPDTAVPEQLVRAVVADRMAEYLDRLPAQERACLRLRYADELSSEQIGAVLERSVSGVRTLQYRATRRLVAMLAHDGITSLADLTEGGQGLGFARRNVA